MIYCSSKAWTQLPQLPLARQCFYQMRAWKQSKLGYQDGIISCWDWKRKPCWKLFFLLETKILSSPRHRSFLLFVYSTSSVMGSRPAAGPSSAIKMQVMFNNTIVSLILVSALHSQIIDTIFLITSSHSTTPSYDGSSFLKSSFTYICPQWQILSTIYLFPVPSQLDCSDS